MRQDADTYTYGISRQRQQQLATLKSDDTRSFSGAQPFPGAREQPQIAKPLTMFSRVRPEDPVRTLVFVLRSCNRSRASMVQSVQTKPGFPVYSSAGLARHMHRTDFGRLGRRTAEAGTPLAAFIAPSGCFRVPRSTLASAPALSHLQTLAAVGLALQRTFPLFRE